MPWLKTLDSSVAAVNQGGKRKGAACVYLEPWHADIEEFLELRDNTGDDARRTHNLNLANWIPDLFMRRVEADGEWSLFDPKDVPRAGRPVRRRVRRAPTAQAEAAGPGRAARSRPASCTRRMMRTLAQTGNGWMTFKDAVQPRRATRPRAPGNVVHLSNLCTEILEVTDDGETAVCNLGSINLGAHFDAPTARSTSSSSRDTVRTAVHLPRPRDRPQLLPDRPRPRRSNPRWRPVGLGVMGLQDVFFQLRLPFDSPEARGAVHADRRARSTSTRYEPPCELAERARPAPGLRRDPRRPRRAAVRPLGRRARPDRSAGTRCASASRQHGLRNSLLIAIAPTATIASIAGCYECIEPQVSNLFKRETLSGEFLQVNRYLVDELKALRPVDAPRSATRIKRAEGSVQGIAELPEDAARALPHGVGDAACAR